jgi:hypothetical protein
VAATPPRRADWPWKIPRRWNRRRGGEFFSKAQTLTSLVTCTREQSCVQAEVRRVLAAIPARPRPGPASAFSFDGAASIWRFASASYSGDSGTTLLLTRSAPQFTRVFGCPTASPSRGASRPIPLRFMLASEVRPPTNRTWPGSRARLNREQRRRHVAARCLRAVPSSVALGWGARAGIWPPGHPSPLRRRQVQSFPSSSQIIAASPLIKLPSIILA